MRKMITSTTTPTIAITGRAPNAPRLCAIHSARPELRITPASDKPPPNSSNTPHGSLPALSQFIRNTRFLVSTGMMNSASAAAMAMLVSFTPDIQSAISGWNIQASAVTTNTSATSFSPRLSGPSSASSLRIS